MVAVQKNTPLLRLRPRLSWAIPLVAHLGLPLTLLLAFLVRGALILRSPGVLDGDEALVGIQAQQIATHAIHPFPVFFYGQLYMGSFESYMAALVFRVIGPSVPALRLVPLLFGLLFVLVTYLLARRIIGYEGGVFAAIVAAVPPLYPAVWSLKARGGYIETLALGSALLLISHYLLYEEDKRPSIIPATWRRPGGYSLWWFPWGVLAGLLFWINPISMYYILAGATAIIVVFLRRHWETIHQGGVGKAFLPCTLVVVGIVLGGLPLWAANIASHGATFTYLLSGASGAQGIGERVSQVVLFLGTAALPVLVGAWEPWGAPNSPLLGVIALGVYSCAAVTLVLRFVAERRGVLGSHHVAGRGHGLLILFTVIVAVVFSVSGFGGTALNPQGFDAATRYTLPLFSVLPIAIGALTWRLWQAWLPLGTAVLMGIIMINLYGFTTMQANSIFQSEYWTKLPPSQEPLVRFLDNHHIHSVWMNHWAGYPLMFYANGRVAAADYNDVVIHGGVNRLPWTLQQAKEDRHPAYILVTSEEHPPLEGLLKSWGVRSSKTRVGTYLVFWNLSYAIPPAAVAHGLDFAY